MTVIAKKITGKDWRPERILGAAVDVKRFFCGVLVGSANGIIQSTGNDGELLEGLKGRFLYKDSDPKIEDKAAYVLWLPSGMGADLFEAPRRNEMIEFAFKVWSVRAENAAKRAWEFEPLIEASAADPLAALMSRIGEVSADMKALPAPAATGLPAVAETVAQVPATPAAETVAAGKGKGK